MAVDPLLEWHGIREFVVRVMIALRAAATTAAAVLVGIANTLRRVTEPSVTVKPGDRAPDFSLRGSDGQMYRLEDFRGRSAVVLAWFPKAFTGG